ncbi:MAG: hypothetical protein ACEPOZ_20735 [Marinifilaceae bacterium]
MRRKNKSLKKEIKGLKREVKYLKEENQNLQVELASSRHKKDSSNSNIPPSSDIGKPKQPRSLRKSSGKKPEGQSGHKGTTLKMTTTPDLFVDHPPMICEQYGSSSLELPANLAGRRQVINMPPILALVTKHRVFSKQCKWGYCTLSQFPAQVKAPVSYGPLFKV